MSSAGRGRDVLRNAYFLQRLDDSVIDAVLRQCQDAQVRAGELIFREGEQGSRLYIVLSGAVEVWKHFSQADQKLLARYDVGRFFGEMALVDELPRSATAVAAEHTTLMYLRREDFGELVRRYPELAESVMRSLSAIVRESNDSFVADLHHRNTELESAYRQLERAQRDLLENERLSNLGKMSNMIMHDIRNPVSVVHGYAQTLLAAADDPERVRDLAGRIAAEAERLGYLSAELLDYARGEVRLDLSVVQPARVIAEARRYAEIKLKGSGVVLEEFIHTDEPVVVDAQRVARAVMNLLDNARKACGSSGTISVTVDRSGEELRIVVADTGVGMSREVASRVFEPFFSRLGGDGTGLGMVIVRNIVEAHGGRLHVSSREGRGTRVELLIPAGVR